LHYFEKTMRENAAMWFELNEPEIYEKARANFLEHY